MHAMQSRRIHKGFCVCGRVAFELEEWLDVAVECRCSICRRFAPLWQGASEATLRIGAGVDELSTYSCGDTIPMELYFCRHCGVRLFMRLQSDPARWAVNLNCLNDLDASKLERRCFDDGRQGYAVVAFGQAS
jgi:hypothetical protein